MADPASGAPARAPDIVCRAVEKTFGRGAAAVPAVAPTDVSFAPGTTTALVGPSGCGKSTLLRMIAGLDAPTGGSIRIAGRTPGAVRNDGALAMAFQDPSLLPWRSVAKNVALARTLARRAPDPGLVDDLIGKVGLEGFGRRRPSELSGGMRQRAAIARALATEPTLVLLDEPFGAVDELTRRRLNLELPPVWSRNGATVLMVTHSVAEAVLVSDRVLVLSPRPARILADIAIPLTRPRGAEMTHKAEFRALVSEIEAALAGDAVPSLAKAAE
ncbi:MAG: ABC transporter ATP-binding protein [Pseudomonadota bacterium]